MLDTESTLCDWGVTLSLQRKGVDGRPTRGRTPPRVDAPMFPKRKEEGWVVLVGDEAARELFALHRVVFGGQRRVTVRVPR